MNNTEIYKFKANDSEIVTSQCLGNISKDWSADNMKKTGFTGYVYDFSSDYDSTDVDDIKDIHSTWKCLNIKVLDEEKWYSIKCKYLRLLKRCFS